MLRQLNHAKLSQPYINALNEVTVTEIPFQSDQTDPSPNEPKSHHDQSFLAWVHRYADAQPEFQTSFPNIVQVAMLTFSSDPSKHNPRLQLYSKDTHLEFHLLLLYILEIYHMSGQTV